MVTEGQGLVSREKAALQHRPLVPDLMLSHQGEGGLGMQLQEGELPASLYPKPSSALSTPFMPMPRGTQRYPPAFAHAALLKAWGPGRGGSGSEGSCEAVQGKWVGGGQRGLWSAFVEH